MTDTEAPKETFAQRLERLKTEVEGKREAAPASPASPGMAGTDPSIPVAHDADLVPEVEAFDDHGMDAEVDRVVDGIDIVQAYVRWCGKMTPEVGTKRESIMISCPKPDHRDSNPSAWINLDEDLWFCGGCQEGGDKYDIAAWGIGFPVPAYKEGKSFPDLKRAMAAEFGYFVKTTPGGVPYLDGPGTPAVAADLDGEPEPQPEPLIAPPAAFIAPVETESDAPDPSSHLEEPPTEPPTFSFPNAKPQVVPEDQDEPDLTGGPGAEPDPTPLTIVPPLPAEGESTTVAVPGVTPLYTEEDKAADREMEAHLETFVPNINWRTLFPEDTFMGEWMLATEADDLPTEFYFWLGLQAVGLAIGRNAVLMDNPVVRGNLFVCLLGRTGQGKSRASGALVRLLHEALPHDWDDPESTGTFMVPSAGSAEALIDSFCKPITDEDGKVVGQAPVRGLIRFDELSTLMGRAQRTGNPMKPILMEFYDGYHDIEHKTRGAGTVKASGYFACTVTSTQPKAIRGLVERSDADSGFLNRWVFAYGHAKAPVAYGRQPLDLTRSVETLQQVRAWASTGRQLHLEGKALDAFNNFYYTKLYPKVSEDDQPLLSRADLTIKKLILLMAANRKLSMPDLACVNAAIQLWEYLFQTYLFVAGEVDMGPMQEITESITKAIERHIARKPEKPPTMRDIRNSLAKRNYDPEMMARAIKVLIALQIIEENVVPTHRGPKRIVYTMAAAS